MNVHSSGPRISKALYWLPRLLSILAILFISLFALDAFEQDLSFWQNLSAFFIHLIPSYILTAILIYTWYHEKWGGIIFLLLGFIFSPIIFNWNFRMNSSLWLSLGIIASISIPFIVVGILFLVHYAMKRKSSD